MQTFDITEIKAMLEDMSSYEEKITYLKKILIELGKRYEKINDILDDILDECERKQQDYLYNVLRDKLFYALKDAGIDIPIGEDNEVCIVYGKAQFKIPLSLNYDKIYLSVNIRSRKYRENLISLLPDYECSDYSITKDVTEETYIAEFVALVKKLLDSKEIIIQWNKMLR